MIMHKKLTDTLIIVQDTPRLPYDRIESGRGLTEKSSQKGKVIKEQGALPP
ncbi:hypothetical protein PHLCEN_2v6872 [Hermanssonia centrifuga]|uniref:Uncharacterized protein n=1 Tax=Hermanssonia centrifuga TaxID=98765 RepID=A0A2R6NY33_9APHY|nr:hypothetical protein PHLCEN_2v6872 [Hermanssonia centrifuga]